MTTPDPRLAEVFTRAEAEKKGMGTGQIQRRLASGDWMRLRRGAFCLRDTWETADRAGRYRIQSFAAAKALGGRHVISHASAAVLHGLPSPRDLRRVWLTAPSGTSTRYLDGLVVEAAGIPDADLWYFDRVPATSPARTVVDCLRHLSEVDAVAIADDAARRHPDLVPHVARVTTGCAGWPFASRARRRARLVDGRRESFAESWSFVVMHQRGLPLPEPQVVVMDEDGRFVARVDALWEERGVVGEVDGLVKYGVGSDLPVDAARRAVIAEKKREKRLTDLGLEVVRWGTKDLARPQEFGSWLHHELSRRRPRTVTAQFRSTPPRPLLAG